jgi:hypothetical protein
MNPEADQAIGSARRRRVSVTKRGDCRGRTSVGALVVVRGCPCHLFRFWRLSLTCVRARSMARHERATSSDTPNHSVSVDRRGFRGVRLPLFLCGGSERLDYCGGRFNGLCRTILALGRVHQPGSETGQLNANAPTCRRSCLTSLPCRNHRPVANNTAANNTVANTGVANAPRWAAWRVRNPDLYRERQRD